MQHLHCRLHPSYIDCLIYTTEGSVKVCIEVVAKIKLFSIFIIFFHFLIPSREKNRDLCKLYLRPFKSGNFPLRNRKKSR